MRQSLLAAGGQQDYGFGDGDLFGDDDLMGGGGLELPGGQSPKPYPPSFGVYQSEYVWSS